MHAVYSYRIQRARSRGARATLSLFRSLVPFAVRLRNRNRETDRELTVWVRERMPKAEQARATTCSSDRSTRTLARAGCVQRHDPDPIVLRTLFHTEPCPMRAIPVPVIYPLSLFVSLCVCVCCMWVFFALFPLPAKRPISRHRPRPHFLFGATLRYTCIRKGTGRASSLARATTTTTTNNHHHHPYSVPMPVPGTCQPVCRWRRIVRKFTSWIPTSIGIGFSRFGPVGHLPRPLFGTGIWASIDKIHLPQP